MDIAGEYMLFIGQNAAAVIGKDKTDLGVFLFAERPVVRDIIDAGKGVGVASEQLAVTGFVQHVCPGVYALFIKLVEIHQMIAHLV